MPTAKTRAEVWGSPIGHSLSPALHRAAYVQQGLDWVYDSREVTEASLAETLDIVPDSVLGLSLTMPLKEKILDLVEHRSPVVGLLGVANTVVRDAKGWTLDNTDPWGVAGALVAYGGPVSTAWIFGAGATARSVGYALHLGGAKQVTLVVRDPSRATATASVLESLGVAVSVVTPGSLSIDGAPDLVVSTLPGDVAFPLGGDISWLTRKAGLVDVSYSPWPSSAATAWEGSPRPVVSGLTMLVHQAIRQVRLFVHHDAELPLPEESRVLEAMERAVGSPPA